MNSLLLYITITALVAVTSAQIPLLGVKSRGFEPFKILTQSKPIIRGNIALTPINQQISGDIHLGPANAIKTVVKTTKTVNFGTPVIVDTFTTEIRTPPTLEQIIEQDWSNFKTIYNKKYTPAEESFRKEIFIENRQAIIDFNTKFSSGEVTFAQQLNAYSDMLPHEFNQRYNGFNRSALSHRVKLPTPTTFIPSANTIVPERMDWRDEGAVTGVKTQGDCMGCYAFASAGALESHTFRKTGKLIDLSPQQIIDCSKNYGNEGCKGGLMSDSYEYVKNQPGLDSWDAYPYEAQDGQCRFKPEAVEAICTGYVELPAGDEKALETAVATVGPVSVAIDASQRAFQFYREGVYFDPTCKNKQEDMNHGVLIVGFGVEPDGKKYWIVKNSYGPQWGNGGYVKMAKDAGNHCGIANSATYPLV
ncbi:hypothetical protein WA026_007426 [Henosepilachna vigintioctopunctata]|uniref:Cathepsin L n=1 Tax=Henosepilachna vigintioctopunctata TaxID=420089 RepID=A0AAW1UX91_9CUCU